MFSVDGDAKAIQIFDFEAERSQFPDAEIAVHVERVREEQNGQVFDDFCIWNRADSPTNPYFKENGAGSYTELEKGMKVLFAGSDPGSKLKIRAEFDSITSGSEY